MLRAEPASSSPVSSGLATGGGLVPALDAVQVPGDGCENGPDIEMMEVPSTVVKPAEALSVTLRTEVGVDELEVRFNRIVPIVKLPFVARGARAAAEKPFGSLHTLPLAAMGMVAVLLTTSPICT